MLINGLLINMLINNPLINMLLINMLHVINGLTCWFEPMYLIFNLVGGNLK